MKKFLFSSFVFLLCSNIAFPSSAINLANSGIGNVSGPSSATNNAIAIFNGTTGNLIKNSTVSIDSSGNVSGGIWQGTTTEYAVFLTSGTTFTTPSTLSANAVCQVTVIGGGGGGSGSNTANASGGGGGGGGVGIKYFSGVFLPSTTYTYAIGAAGTAGNASPSVGGGGGNTSITIPVGGTTYQANGGSGGAVGAAGAGGAGGTLSGFGGSDVQIIGQAGGAQSGGTVPSSGYGGNSGMGWGLGGSASPGNGSIAGNAGTGYGGGGGAGRGTGETGGAGTQGAILIECKN